MCKPYVLGIDIGGTNTVFGMVDARGEVIAGSSIKTFTYFDNAKQLSRFIGICPTIEQSGTSINIRGHINRNGDETLRSMLYVAAWSASQHNKACKECYQRLRGNGKSGKVAMIAVANKLVRQAFAVVTSNNSYIDGFVSTKPDTTV